MMTPPWDIPKMWLNETAYIIGGGYSLHDVEDWSAIHDENVIGCNDAYTLGSWVDVCCFGDRQWLKYHWNHRELRKFKGIRVSCMSGAPAEHMKQEGIKWTTRTPRQLGKKAGEVGWNGSTGGAAIDLALQFGASRIILFGYDMHVSKDEEDKYRNNWHENILNVPNPRANRTHRSQMGRVKEGLANRYPKVEVINANMESSLDLFKKVPREEFLCIS